MMPCANIWKTAPLMPVARSSSVEPEQHDAHVGDAREPDDELEVGLPHGDERPVDDVDRGQDRERSAPSSAAPSGRNVIADAEDAERAELHEHAGVQHRHRGRRGDVTGRRPPVEREHAGQDAEADVQERIDEDLERRALKCPVGGERRRVPRCSSPPLQ